MQQPIIMNLLLFLRTGNKFRGTKKLKMYIGQTETLYRRSKNDSRVMVISASHDEFNGW